METNDIGENSIGLPELPQNNEHSGIELSDVIEVLRGDMFQNNPSMVGAGAQVIDPTQPSTSGYNGNALMPQQQQQQQQQQQTQQQLHQQQQQSNAKNIRRKACVKITEQPAGKALRFRYECEGRSAGSIPGVNSTPENKTFPTIEIVGYKGRAVVVVSCVTKDQPYKPHPHNLVGKEGCKKGVCTLEINSETMRAVFSNLGIQCVKKKDIESHLRAREDIRVDPFKTGFSHKFQPSSIDLNSVRLCFQVFLESEVKGRFTVPLPPVVSDPIFDKKAMSDLVICRLCSCSSTVYGGKEIILLCEKVAKEDISVRFFEEHNGHVIWEGFGDFQHTDVHKQTAITFRTPRYRTMEIEQPVKVFIQLRRPSDGATSEALPFDYLPLESGRRTFWAIRKNLKRKADMGIFQQILNEDKAATLAAQQAIPKYQEVGVQSDIINLDTPTDEEQSKSFGTDDEESTKRRMEKVVDNIINEKIKELELEVRVPEQYQHANTQTQDSTPQTEEADGKSAKEDAMEPRQLSANDKITEWLKSSDEFERTESGTPPGNEAATAMTTSTVVTSEEDKTLNDLLDQSEELEEIYTESKLRLETYNNTLANELAAVEGDLTKNPTAAMDVDESFDDAATYTSLELAFKNPYPMTDVMPPIIQLPPERADHYDSVEIIVNPPAPIIDVVKIPSPLSNSNSFVGDENVPPLPPKRIRKQDGTVILRNSPTSVRPSPIIIMNSSDHSPPTKKLPPTPNNNTLPRQKKPGFFSKLFSRRKSRSDLSQTASSPGSKAASPVGSREPSVTHFSLNDTNRSSIRSLKSLQPTSISASSSPTNGPKTGKTSSGKPVGRSVSSVSGKRPHLTADVIHIPLKGDSSNSLPMQEAYSDASTITLSNTLDRKTVSAMQLVDIPITDGNMELVAIADRQSLKNLCEGQFGVELHPSVDLTEAEHFALYTSIPPQATANPAVLKRKRQKTGGDASKHLFLHFQQQQQQQLNPQQQNELPDGRGQDIEFLKVMPNSAIKTEPGDTSPLPYGMYSNAYRMPVQTPSPQPLSPSNTYNQNTNGTPSPYSIGNGGNSHLMSPNHPYEMTGGGAGAGHGTQIEYDPYHQQHASAMNPFNQMQSPNTHTPQQWPNAASIKQTMSNINNLSNFNVNNILTKTAAPSAASTSIQAANNNQPWNLPGGLMVNNNYNIHQLMANTQHNQHHQQVHNHNQNEGGDPVAASTNEAPTLSSLLNMDSEQLMHFNSEELSNLSIS